MQIVGYIIGSILIAVCLGLSVYNIVKLVKLIKERRKLRNQEKKEDIN